MYMMLIVESRPSLIYGYFMKYKNTRWIYFNLQCDSGSNDLKRRKSDHLLNYSFSLSWKYVFFPRLLFSQFIYKALPSLQTFLIYHQSSNYHLYLPVEYAKILIHVQNYMRKHILERVDSINRWPQFQQYCEFYSDFFSIILRQFFERISEKMAKYLC